MAMFLQIPTFVLVLSIDGSNLWLSLPLNQFFRLIKVISHQYQHTIQEHLVQLRSLNGKSKSNQIYLKAKNINSPNHFHIWIIPFNVEEETTIYWIFKRQIGNGRRNTWHRPTHTLTKLYMISLSPKVICTCNKQTFRYANTQPLYVVAPYTLVFSLNRPTMRCIYQRNDNTTSDKFHLFNSTQHSFSSP